MIFPDKCGRVTVGDWLYSSSRSRVEKRPVRLKPDLVTVCLRSTDLGTLSWRDGQTIERC